MSVIQFFFQNIFPSFPWYGEEVVFDMVEFDVDFLSLYYQSMQVLHLPEAQKDFDSLLEAWEKKIPFRALRHCICCFTAFFLC